MGSPGDINRMDIVKTYVEVFNLALLFKTVQNRILFGGHRCQAKDTIAFKITINALNSYELLLAYTQ